MAKDNKSGLESELLNRKPGRVRAEKSAPSRRRTSSKQTSKRSVRRPQAWLLKRLKPPNRAPTWSQAGDNLSVIAKKVYGDASRWKDILEANKATVKDPNVSAWGRSL